MYSPTSFYARLKKQSLLFPFFFLLIYTAQAQFLMDMVDTTKSMGRGMLGIFQKFDNFRVGGYIQTQFQAISGKGASSYGGGDFATNVNNRFMIRRGRIRFDYVHFTPNNGPSVQFVFQFDGTERGVFIRDFWGRVLENKWQLFSFTTGMFARPFGYELNLSSSDRESPERGRMSQILMKTERDLGAMVSFEPRKKNHPLRFLKIDAGIFNGPGLAAPADFDSHKDFIGRIDIKPLHLSKSVTLGGELSYFNGGLIQNNRYVYTTETSGSLKKNIVDSSLGNTGKIAPRKYYGADLQLKIKNRAGYTELRAEFISGTQTATANSSETPAVLLTGTDGYYRRRFNGGYFYFLQHVVNSHHQLGIKFDWYDPNTRVKKNEIGVAGSNFTKADILYATLGFGYTWYINENLKWVLWYEKVTNEKTNLPGFTSDVKDDLFTCRMQFRF